MNSLILIKKTFADNLESVEKLVNFDRELQDYAIQSVEELHQRLKTIDKLDNPRLNAERTLSVLKNIRANDSLRPRYSAIFNQAVVLLVSYFGSTVDDIFRIGLLKELQKGRNARLLREELRVSLQDIIDLTQNLEDLLPDMFLLKKDISFQDMQSIHRAFDEYLGVTIARDEDTNNVLVGQACRHVIVHKGSSIDDRLIGQVKNAHPRNLKMQLLPDEVLQFSPEEIVVLAGSMSRYIDGLCSKVDALSSTE